MVTINDITIAHRKKAFHTDEQKTIGQQLQQAREAKGLTLEQAAILAGVTAHNIHCYEQGSPAPPDILIKLAREVYRCALHELLHGSYLYHSEMD
ncbi:MAG TPA: helix-turn-helix transcriptional regulator [Ktedonobacteraceae bacterium]|nr:helix-turn-helix transcriptional regulator [Ktedonobacteraceae bacterium]